MVLGENKSINLLTIVIPTFNRREKLNSTLSNLFCQDMSCVKNVIVIDNCSNYELVEFENTFNNGKLEIVRNPFNIGMAANVVNTFRYCETDWMWLLSDDDAVDSNAISSIKNEINKCQNWAIIKFLDVFAFNKIVTDDFTLNKLEDFIGYYEKVGHRGEMIFMSNGIYNIKALRGYMERCFNYSYTQIPHVVLLMTALNSGQSVRFVNAKIVTYKDPDEGNQWVPLDVYLGISTISYVPFDLSSDYKKKLYSLFIDKNIGAIYYSIFKEFSEYKLHQFKSINNNLWKLSKERKKRFVVYVLTVPVVVSFFKNNQHALDKIKEFYIRLIKMIKVN